MASSNTLSVVCFYGVFTGQYAGIADGAPCDWVSVDQYKKVMDVNFFAMVGLVKAALPMLKRSKGRIVNVSSIAGQIPGLACMTPYGASKHAADTFTNGLRIELKAWGIKVRSLNHG